MLYMLFSTDVYSGVLSWDSNANKPEQQSGRKVHKLRKFASAPLFS